VLNRKNTEIVWKVKMTPERLPDRLNEIIGAKVVRHTRAVTFQLAGLAVTHRWFATIRTRIDRLRPVTGTS
jgi:hypothetical protein